jgi:hypothetical protein
MYESLYNEWMQEFYTRAHTADKKHVTGILLGGSTKRLLTSGKYNGLPTTVNSLGMDDKLVTEPNTIKSVTKEYWFKLYKQQDTPDIPKPWLNIPSVTEVQKQVEQEPFKWPVPTSVADFQAMLRKENHQPTPGPDEWEKWCVKNLSDDLSSHELYFPGKCQGYVANIYSQTRYPYKSTQLLWFDAFEFLSKLTYDLAQLQAGSIHSKNENHIRSPGCY